MNQNMKRVFALILALALVIGATLSLSSCLSSLDIIIGGFDEMIPPTPDENGGAEGGENNNSKPSDENKGEAGSESADNENKGEAGSESEDSENKDDPSTDNTAGDDNKDGKDESSNITFYPGTGEESLENLSALNRTILSTVAITSRFNTSPSSGSGVIYKLDKESGDAYIITNFHVVFNSMYGFCNSATLYLYGMETSTYAIEAKVLGGSANYDIAILKVEGSEVLKKSYAIEATIADSNEVRVFDKVVAVGNAEGYGIAATMGIVSVESEKLAMTGADGSAIELRVMRVDAAINQGNSGGGLYNENGELVGIVCAKRTGSNVDNMGYAIPSNLARNLAENIIDNCNGNDSTRVKRALLGITITAKVVGLVIDPVTGEMWEEEIVEVAELTSSCIAKNQVEVGDIVNSITVDGVTVEVTRLHHVTDHMLNARAGSIVTMSLTRGGEVFEVTVTVPESAISIVK